MAEDTWRQNLRSQRGVDHTDAEICVNCWYFVDETEIVFRLAAKAYALVGSDEEKLQVLRSLAAADHLTATQAAVATKYVVDADGKEFQGAVPVQVTTCVMHGQIISALEFSSPRGVALVACNYWVYKRHLPISCFNDRPVSEFGYDRTNQLIWQDDASGAITDYEYDQRGLLRKTTLAEWFVCAELARSKSPSLGQRL